MTQLPIPVHVGCEPPESWDDIEARQREFGEDASPWLQKQRRLTVARATLDWSALGFEPRWLGFDTADCVAALQPSIFAGHGADEFDRFRLGAKSRGEIALVISPVGGSDDKRRNVFGQYGNSVYVGALDASIEQPAAREGREGPGRGRPRRRRQAARAAHAQLQPAARVAQPVAPRGAQRAGPGFRPGDSGAHRGDGPP